MLMFRILVKCPVASNTRRLVGMLCILLLLPIALRADEIKKVWRWQPDPELNQKNHGARGMWRGELWGLDYLNKKVWAFDGKKYKPGGSVPANTWPLTSIFTSHGVFALAPRREGAVQTADVIYSPDGYQDFKTVLSLSSSTDGKSFALGQDHTLVDLGGGRVMMFQYSDESRVMYSEDAGQNWRKLFEPDGDSMRHWHGAYYDAEYGKLYAMGGDSDTHSTITWTDDLFGPDGFINNPDLWKRKWGLLDDKRTTREDKYFLDPDGVIFSQRSRTVDMGTYGDYIYWGEDRASAEGISLYRAHRRTGEVNEVGQGDIVGSPWRFLETDDHDFLFATNSVWYQKQLVAGSDKWIRIYRLNEDATDYDEMARFPISKKVVSGADPIGFVEAFDRLWINGYMITEVHKDLVGNLVEVGWGDFDNDQQLSVQDVDTLSRAIRRQDTLPIYDLDLNGMVELTDLRIWVKDVKNTYFGDSNLDGVFNSQDLIAGFVAGTYEDSVVGNASWGTGDWNGDGEFTTTDLTVAFQDGGYDLPRRSAVVASVPEPSTLVPALLGGLGAWNSRRRRREHA
jgi:hypothetical protein